MEESESSPEWLAGFDQEVEAELTAHKNLGKTFLIQEESTSRLEISQISPEIASLRSRVETIQAGLQALIHLSRGAGSKEILAKLPRTADELQEVTRRLSIEAEALQKEASRIGQDNERLSQTQSTVQSSLADMRAKVSLAQESYETRIHALHEQVKALQDQKKILDANLMIQSSRVERLQEDLQRSHAEKTAAERKYLEAQSRVLELERDRMSLGGQVASLQGALDELRRHFPPKSC